MKYFINTSIITFFLLLAIPELNLAQDLKPQIKEKVKKEKEKTRELKEKSLTEKDKLKKDTKKGYEKKTRME